MKKVKKLTVGISGFVCVDIAVNTDGVDVVEKKPKFLKHDN